MWRASILPLALALPCVSAITLHRRDDPAVLGLPISRSQATRGLQKRSSNVASTALYNVINTEYMVNLTIGTPGQNVSLTIDTGSSDLWVNVPNSTYCSGDDDLCSSTGTFDLKKSSTFKLLDYDMNATYLGGYLAAGPYATDKLEIGGATVKDFEFALAEESYSESGIMGIGYKIATDAAAADDEEYDNLPYALAKSGAINSAAYSLWLNKFDGTGNILFGGVNKAKYSGELQTLPVLPVKGRYVSLAIALTEMSLKNSSGTETYTTGLPLAVSLDSGTSMIMLPKELVDPLYEAVGAGYDSKYDVGYVSCDKHSSDANVTFSFSGATVSIPMSELVFENYAEPDFSSGECIFGIGYSSPGENLLGDSFLRSAYVVYDLENNEISIAEADYDGGDDDILEIGTGTTAVPGATKVASAVTSATGNGAVQTTASYSSGAESGTTTASATGTSTGSATQSAESGGGGGGGGATSTSSSALAPLATSVPNHLLSGVLGAGLLLAL